MKFYLSLIPTDQEGVFQVDGWSSSPAPNLVEYELPEDHPFFASFGQYIYDNGELIHDYERVKKELEEQKKREAEDRRRQEIIKNLENILKQKDDEIEELKATVDMLMKMNEDYILYISKLLSELGKNPLDGPLADDGDGEVPVEEEA